MPAATAFVPTETLVVAYAVVGVISRPIATLASSFTLTGRADASDLAPIARMDSNRPNGSDRVTRGEPPPRPSTLSR